MKFAWRALGSLPLMIVVGFCLFGFVDTFEPMPRLRQFSLRGLYGMAGGSALATIVWIWLKPRPGGANGTVTPSCSFCEVGRAGEGTRVGRS